MKTMNVRLLRMLTQHKGQFIAISSVITIGLLIYVSIAMAIANLENSVSHYYKKSHFADIYVEAMGIPQSAIEELEKMEGVYKAQGRIQHDVPLKGKNDTERVTVRLVSIPEAPYKINDIYIHEGSPLREFQRDAYVFNRFAKVRNIKRGDIIYPRILGKEVSLKVRGFISSPEYVYLMENDQVLLPNPEKFGVIFVSESFAMNYFGMSGTYNQIVVKANEGVNLDLLKEKIENKLEPYGTQKVYQKKDQLSHRIVQEEIKQGKKSAQTVPILFLTVAAGIMVIMINRTVQNDRTAIGVFKSMGYTNSQIMGHYIKYCLVIGFFGSILGVFFGTMLSAAFTQLYAEFFFVPYLKLKFYPQYLIMAIFLASFFSVCAGFFGARRVIKIEPADSMRQPPPLQGKRIFLDHTKFWTGLSYTSKMVIRNVLRSKKRFAFITAGIALSYAMMLIPMFQKEAIDDVFFKHYSEFLKMDYKIVFTQPVHQRALKDIEQKISVSNIEPILELPFEFSHLWKKKTVSLIGLKKNTKMYKFKNIKDLPVKVDRRGLVITEGLAKFFAIGKGDFLVVKTFIPGRKDQKIMVSEVIQQNLGLNAYMEIEAMQSLLADRNMITGALIGKAPQQIGKKLLSVPKIQSIQSNQDQINTFQKYLKMTFATITTLVIFSGILGFAIIYNASTISILERKLAFSSLRVMGFHKNEIFGILLRENVLMSTIGILLGIPLGRLFLKAMVTTFSTDIYTLKIDVPFGAYVITGVLTMTFVMLAQGATYSKIQKLDFIEALKNRMT